MANFGLGLTQGFRTGLQAAEAYEQRQERERQRELQRQLAQVYSATPTGGPRAPTEAELQRAQAETQDIVEKDIKEFAKFGLTPEEADRYRARTALMRQQDIDPSMGGGVGLVPTTTARVAAPYQLYGVDLGTKPDPQAIAAARGLEAARLMGAAGRVSDALALEQASRRSLQDMAERPIREQENALRLRVLQQQADAGDREARAALRKQTEDENLQRFDRWRAENPGLNLKQLNAASVSFGLTPDQRTKVASSLLGIKEAELKSKVVDIQDQVQGKSFRELLTLHKSSDLIDPNFHYQEVKGPKGQVTLQRFSTADNKPVGQPLSFGNEELATAYLTKSATDPGNVAGFMLELQAKQAQINASNAQAAAAGSTGLDKRIRDLRKTLKREPTEQEVLTLAGITSKDKAPSFAELNAAAKAIIDSGATGSDGKPISWNEALAMARAAASGVPYVDPLQKLLNDAAKAKPTAAPAAAPAAPSAAAQTARVGRPSAPDQPIGLLTPQALIEEQALLGNPQALAELERQRRIRLQNSQTYETVLANNPALMGLF